MTTKQVALNQQTGKDGVRVASFMTVAAWVAFAIGMIVSILNLGTFSDQNLGLMIGIGCLVGSVQIYMIGAAIRLFHSNQEKQIME